MGHFYVIVGFISSPLDREFFRFSSSRRRHTSSRCDWSSDVCSSDLVPELPARRRQRGLVELAPSTKVTVRSAMRTMSATVLPDGSTFGSVRLSRLTWQDIEFMYDIRDRKSVAQGKSGELGSGRRIDT